MDQKQITLEVKLPPKFPSLRLDKDKFEAALVNLLVLAFTAGVSMLTGVVSGLIPALRMSRVAPV